MDYENTTNFVTKEEFKKLEKSIADLIENKQDFQELGQTVTKFDFRLKAELEKMKEELKQEILNELRIATPVPKHSDEDTEKQ